jgi:hypothetical protein
VVPENAFQFRINRVHPSLEKGNSSGQKVKASHLTFDLNVQRNVTY